MKPLTLALTLAFVLSSAACSSPTATTTVPVTAPATVPSATAAAATVGSATPAPPTAGPTLAPTARSTATLAATPTLTPTATADAAIAGGLVGLWQGNNNSFYLFNKDGTWSWDQSGQKVLTAPENQGRWWVEGDVVHIQDVSGLAPCPLGDIGTYQAQLTGDNLALAAVKDPCFVRIAQTSGTYTRQPAGP
jgi:hypothetical protein